MMAKSNLTSALALLFSLLLSEVRAINFAPDVSPTPIGTPVVSNSPSIITGAPTMGRMPLDLRNLLTDIQYPDTCGFIDGNWSELSLQLAFPRLPSLGPEASICA